MASQEQKHPTQEEQEAANLMANLSAARTENSEGGTEQQPPPKKRRKHQKVRDASELSLAPYPFFAYTDHSRDQDVDRLALLEEAEHVPSFPVKLHAILSDPELKSIVSWDSHGRSFRILKPHEFETSVLPRFFDHASMPSFQRQVNGWCFRRLTEGDNRNSYYEEHFLRGLPWLAKKMRRPGVGEKEKTRAEHEPDLAAISAIYPLPTSSIVSREIQVVLDVIKLHGPKAKIPAHWMVDSSSDPFNNTSLREVNNEGMNQAAALAPIQLPAASIPTNNVAMAASQFPSPASQPGLSRATLLALLQQVEHARSLQGITQQGQAPVAPNNANHLVTGLLNTLQNQNNLVLTSLLANLVARNTNMAHSVSTTTSQHAGLVQDPSTTLQALIQATQNQAAAPAAATPGVGNTDAVSALALLLANQNQTSHVATVTPPSSTSQLIMALQMQALANQANINQRSSHVSFSSSSSSTSNNSSDGNNRNGGHLTLEEVNRMFNQK